MARRREDTSERYGEDFERRLEQRVESGRRRVRETPPPEKRTKAPGLLRFFAWSGIIMLCFVAGYQGTSYVVELLEAQPLLRKSTGDNANDLQALLSADEARNEESVKLDIPKKKVALFYLKNGEMVKEDLDFIAQTTEDYIQEAVGRLLTLSGAFEKDIYVKHVFRNVDTVYLDFSSAFPAALSKLGDPNARLFVTGIVRTMQENFSMTRVRFLIEGKVSTAGSPVDLTATWQLPK